MAHFYGSLQGQRGEATRLGSKASGLHITAASWHGAIEVELFERDGVDHYRVVERKWHGAGRERTIAEGVLGEQT